MFHEDTRRHFIDVMKRRGDDQRLSRNRAETGLWIISRKKRFPSLGNSFEPGLLHFSLVDLEKRTSRYRLIHVQQSYGTAIAADVPQEIVRIDVVAIDSEF